MPLFFDIESGGLSGYESSIYSLGYSTGGQPKAIYADPSLGSRMYRWSEQNVWAEVKQKTNRVAEKDLLSQWIKVLQEHQGEELVGWNIGFDVETQERGRARGRPFDIPMTLARAKQYGLHEELSKAYQGMQIRDIGREYAVAVSDQVMANLEHLEGKVDPDILEQAHKFHKAAERARKDLGPTATLRDVAGELSRRRFSLAGWKQEQISSLLDLPEFKAHSVVEDVGALTRFPAAEAMKLSPEKLVEWGRGALKSSLVGQALKFRYKTPPRITWEEGQRVMSQFDRPEDFWEHLKGRAEKFGVTDFEETVEQRVKDLGGDMGRVRRGLGIEESFRIVDELPKEKIAARRAAFDVSGVPWKKVGLGLGVLAGAWMISKWLFSGFDDEYNTIEGLGERGVGPEERKFNTSFGSGWGGLPSELHGQPLDPRILSWRANVWDDAEARADFEAELKLRQENHQRKIGSLKSAEMFAYNRRVVRGLNERNANLKVIHLNRYKVDVEDADTLVLRSKSWFSMEKDIQIRLAGIDAPEVGGHSDDPLEMVRMWQSQAGGEEASRFLRERLEEDPNATVVIDPTTKTYGRYLGVVAGEEGENINLELLRAGAVTALPFGESQFDILSRGAAAEAEAIAQRDRRGIWGLKRYQAIRVAQASIGRPLTHNMLTRVDKMAANLNVGAYGSFLQSLEGQYGDLTPEEARRARKLGRALRKTHGPSSYRLPKKRRFNSVEGLGHKGIGWEIRRQMTDFGSGWIAKALARGIDTGTVAKAVKKLGGPSMGTKTLQSIKRGVPSAKAIKKIRQFRAQVGENIEGQFWRFGEELTSTGAIGRVRLAYGPGGRVGVHKTMRSEESWANIMAEGAEGAVVNPKLLQVMQKDAQRFWKPGADWIKDYMNMMQKESAFGRMGAMEFEGTMQRMARLEYGEMVPDVYAVGKKSFVQEYAGLQHFEGDQIVGKNLPDYMHSVFKKMYDRPSWAGSVMHLDPKIDQFVRKGARYQLADWGISVMPRRADQARTFAARELMQEAGYGAVETAKTDVKYATPIKEMVEEMKEIPNRIPYRPLPGSIDKVAQSQLQKAASANMSRAGKHGGKGHRQAAGSHVSLIKTQPINNKTMILGET